MNCDPWMMTADSFSAQNQIRGFNPDSTTHSFGEPVIEVTHLYLILHQRKRKFKSESRGGASSVPAAPWGPEGSPSPRSPSSTISASVSPSSSCSWKITSSWQASSCILQSLRIFLYFVMARSITVREVCKEFSLCSSSLPDALSVTTCMASDVAWNSTRRSVLCLLQFPREVAALVHFISTCLWFSLRT